MMRQVYIFVHSNHSVSALSLANTTERAKQGHKRVLTQGWRKKVGFFFIKKLYPQHLEEGRTGHEISWLTVYSVDLNFIKEQSQQVSNINCRTEPKVVQICGIINPLPTVIVVTPICRQRPNLNRRQGGHENVASVGSGWQHWTARQRVLTQICSYRLYCLVYIDSKYQPIYGRCHKCYVKPLFRSLLIRKIQNFNRSTVWKINRSNRLNLDWESFQSL